MNKNGLYIIAVDGPAGAGKSTVCSDVAKELGILHLVLDDINISIDFENGVQIMYLDGENVNSLIRTNEVSLAASACAVIPEVRIKMVELQRKTAQKISMIVDGRDICTYVFPDTPYKFYITADVSERAKRRFAQLAQKGVQSDIAELEKEIAARDFNDMNRKMAPLKLAPDAVLIDTTHMTQKEVVDKLLSYIK